MRPEREKERKDERERHIDERETSISCLPQAPQPGIRPWPGIEPTTFWYMEWCSYQLSHTGQANVFVLKIFSIWFTISLDLYFKNNFYDFGIKKLHLGSWMKEYFLKRNVDAFSIYPLNKSTQYSNTGCYENKTKFPWIERLLNFT